MASSTSPIATARRVDLGTTRSLRGPLNRSRYEVLCDLRLVVSIDHLKRSATVLFHQSGTMWSATASSSASVNFFGIRDSAHRMGRLSNKGNPPVFSTGSSPSS
jgi:hypothetical protein